jgi:hypothetical protein
MVIPGAFASFRKQSCVTGKVFADARTKHAMTKNKTRQLLQYHLAEIIQSLFFQTFIKKNVNHLTS